MLYAKKSNRVQPIAESEVQRFLNMGYNIIDVKGNVLAESMPEDVGGLKAAFKKHTEEIAKLRACVAEYEKQTASIMEVNNQLSVENETLKPALEQAEKARAPKTTKAKKAKDAEAPEAESESND